MPLRLLILAFALGAAVLQRQLELPDQRWFWLMPSAFLMMVLMPDKGHGRLPRGLLSLVLAVSAGSFMPPGGPKCGWRMPCN